MVMVLRTLAVLVWLGGGVSLFALGGVAGASSAVSALAAGASLWALASALSGVESLLARGDGAQVAAPPPLDLRPELRALRQEVEALRKTLAPRPVEQAPAPVEAPRLDLSQIPEGRR